jgi:uncharacterized protein
MSDAERTDIDGAGRLADPSPAPPPDGSTPGPVQESDRIVALDVLRGFALLGILVMNIQAFAMIGTVYFNPTSPGGYFEGAGRVIWLLSYLLTDSKFMAIFSALFGAGVVLMTTRAEKKGRRPLALYYTRTFWLAVFGILHAWLLWPGDILFTYAVSGAWIVLLRRLRPATLVIAGLLVLGIGSGVFLMAGLSAPSWPPEALAEATADQWHPTPEMVEEELATMRGPWLGQLPSRAEEALIMETFVLLIWGVWRASGVMLIGMALFKWGVLGAERSRRFYRGMVVVGIVAGLPIVAYGAWLNFETGWQYATSFFINSQLNYWGSLLVAGGWIGAVMLACRSRWLPRLQERLAAVGRMAFTHYILHTVICTTIFYGHGLGLYGSVDRVGQTGIVVAIWALQLWLSPLWLERFRFGPLEWIWRSLTYGRVPPLRRAAAEPA